MRPATHRRLRRLAIAVAAVFCGSTAITFYAAGHIRVLTGHSYLDLWRAERRRASPRWIPVRRYDPSQGTHS
ncbi:hypothetical protein GCM10023196_037530 [Actinoallomurus vinaceus]|uniref:Uncharacterized protein n=1 Tax=Actinoallomurus vinaceus TaxID=1080074 RepID=A0ABP8UCP1_9ACTN